MREGKYAVAAEAFARLAEGFPASTRRLEAIVKAATARARMEDWSKVIDLLGAGDGLFQALARTNAASGLSFQGQLLLSEAQLNRTNLAGAEAALEPLGRRTLDATNAWAWHYLVCRLRVAQGRLQEALDNTTNLTVLAAKTMLPGLQAQTAAFRGETLEKLGRFEDAVAAYTNNLSNATPGGRQREALARTTVLLLSQNKIDEAIRTAEGYLSQNPPGAAADLGYLTAGELHLRQFVRWLASNGSGTGGTNAAAASNHLEQAAQLLKTAETQFGGSPLGARFFTIWAGASGFKRRCLSVEKPSKGQLGGCRRGRRAGSGAF